MNYAILLLNIVNAILINIKSNYFSMKIRICLTNESTDSPLTNIKTN